jgi:uncharacterized protein YcfJ
MNFGCVSPVLACADNDADNDADVTLMRQREEENDDNITGSAAAAVSGGFHPAGAGTARADRNSGAGKSSAG